MARPPREKVRFSSNLPRDERDFLRTQDKIFRARYYMYVFTTKKKGKEPLYPRAYNREFSESLDNAGVVSFNDIANTLDLTTSQVKAIYESAMLKIKAHFGVIQ